MSLAARPRPAGEAGVGYWAVALAGLGLLLWANYYLRSSLETSGEYLYNFYRYFYPDAERVIFGPDFPAWRRLLPFDGMTGSWSPTVLVLTHYVSDWLGPARTWFVFNGVVIVVSFALSWAVFRSRVFGFTLAICMGFGTHLYYIYPNSGLIGFPLLFCYYQLLLLCIWRVVTAHDHRRAWQAAFGVALIVTVLAYETWLDFLVFVWLASAILGLLLWQRDERVWLRRLAGVVAVMTAVGLVYVYLKVTLGYGQQRGMESDLVFNYPYLAPAVEDVISNLFLNLYMALTVFLPPMFVTSMAFYQLGGDRLVELQHGYHAPFAYLVPMQAMFLWRYYAGALAVVFVYALVRTVRATWRSPSFYRVAALVFMIMIAAGGPTHTFIKARPLNSMAVQTYHVLTAVLGVSLLIALGLMLAWQRWPRPWKGGAVVAAAWAVIFYAALARPGVISHQAAQSGLGVQVYPNPLATLAIKRGRPFEIPGGLHLYQLERHDPARTQPPPAADSEDKAGAARAPATFGVPLPPLPTPAPPLTEWMPFEGVSVEAAGAGWVVQGNDTAQGYQLVSPAIPVPRRQQLLVRVAGANEVGRACLGVLNEDQTQWLLPPVPGRPEHSVHTGSNAQVWLAFVNCMANRPVQEQSRFTVDQVTYGIVQDARDERP